MKTEHDIETMLRAETATSLGVSEKAEMKSYLLRHAAATLEHEKPAVSHWQLWLQRGAFTFASVLLVFVGTGFAAADSLPGESLYAVKVHVVEEMVGLTKFDTEARLDYNLALLERRHSEIIMLARENIDLNIAASATMSEEIESHIDEALEATANLEADDTFTKENVLDTISEIGSIVYAQENATKQNMLLTELGSAIKTSRRDIDAVIDAEVAEFVEESTGTTSRAYLADIISDVTEQLADGETEQNILEEVEMKLEDAQESLTEENVTEAIISALEADQAFPFDEAAETEIIEDEREAEVGS